MPKHIVKFVMIFGFVSGTVAAAADPTPPFTVATNSAGVPLLGGQLETRFTDFLRGCSGITPPLKMKKGVIGSEKAVSSINADVIDGLKLTTEVPLFRALPLSLGRVFGFVYGDADKANPSFVQGQYLSIADDDQAKILAPGFPTLRYETSCGSVIESALRVNAEYSFPGGTLRSALQADYKSDTRSSLQLASGRFISPIWEMWSIVDASKRRPGDRFYAAVLFWDWHKKRDAVQSWSLITYFDGVVLYRQKTKNGSSSILFSADGRASVPIVTASANASASASGSSTLEITDFAVFIQAQRPGGAPSFDFQPLPSIPDVVQAFETDNELPPLKFDDGNLIQNGETKIFSAAIPKLPAVYCFRSKWEIRDDRNATEKSTTMDIVDAQEAGGICKMQLSYAPPPVAAGSATIDTVVSPILFSVDQQQGQSLRLALGKSSFIRTPNPDLSYSNSKTLPPAAVPGSVDLYNLVWTIDLKLVDDGKYADITRIDTREVRLTCPSGTFTAGNPDFEKHDFVGTSGETSRTLRLTGIAQYQGKVDLANVATVACTLSGDILLRPAGGGAPARRTVPSIQLSYPRSVG